MFNSHDYSLQVFCLTLTKPSAQGFHEMLETKGFFGGFAIFYERDLAIFLKNSGHIDTLHI